jgi:hypothetical protein
MATTLLDMISKAAARANEQITAVQKGEYRPKVEVITPGKDRHPLTA